MKRTDIKQHDVFISWTGRDRALKDRIVGYLRDHGLRCLESDEGCSGDFRQWSREAVGACSVFLLILTEHTLQSAFVPIEVEEYKKLEDHENRIVPVAADLALYQTEPWGISEYGSAVILDGNEPEERHLEAILRKVEALIINRLDRIYRQATEPDFMKLVPLCKTRSISDREFDCAVLYIPRTVTEIDENRAEITSISAAGQLIGSQDILFISGAAGSGKTRYVDQLRKAAEADTLVLSMPCHKLTGWDTDLYSLMYQEFSRICGNRCFFTQEDFRSLLNSRRLVLILDGMDEIPNESGTRSFLGKVEAYYRSNAERTTLIFTSRNEADAGLISMNGKKARRFRLRMLNEEEIRTLGRNLFLVFGDPEKDEEFYVSVKDLGDEIRANPLLLSQLAMIYQDFGEIPGTVVGICEAVSEIMFRLDRGKELSAVPEYYREMVTSRIGSILKAFSRERYQLLSQGKQIHISKIFSRVLKAIYPQDSRERAEFLVEYLQNRAILVDGEFYHKMFLEYFTAVYYYEHSFDDYEELESPDTVAELFSHYEDPYWETVLKLFLVKADGCVDAATAKQLYRLLVSRGIREYTLLFEACREMLRHKETAQQVLVADILGKSADGTYPPYGPLFWYVPEYELFACLLMALEDRKGQPHFPKELALARDVCVMFSGKNTAGEITDRVDGRALYQAAENSLPGVRSGLCELFFTGSTGFTGGADIYPRCFNVPEAQAFLERGFGVSGRMETPFEDGLGMFSHEMYSEMDDAYIGIIACPYHRGDMTWKLNSKSCTKVSGLILSPTAETQLSYVGFNRSGVKAFYIPENITGCGSDSRLFMPLRQDFACGQQGIFYFGRFLRLSGVEKIEKELLRGCTALTEAELCDGIRVIGEGAFRDCINLKEIRIPDTVTEIHGSAFAGCGNLRQIRIPAGLKYISSGVFRNCKSLEEICFHSPGAFYTVFSGMFAGCSSLRRVILPMGVTDIQAEAFRDCTSLREMYIPHTVTEIGREAFRGCTGLTEIGMPRGVREIGPEAFCGCEHLNTVLLSEGVETIERGAFQNCTGLTELRIPDSVVNLRWYIFEGCSGLRKLILPGRFRGAVSRLGIPAETEIEFYDGALSERDRPGIGFIDSEEISIEADAYAYRSGLRRVQVPDHIRFLGARAFKGCINLEEVILPYPMEVIGPGAFAGCTGLKRITVPENTRMIGDGAFVGCVNLRQIVLPARFRERLAELGIGEHTTVEFTGEYLETVDIPWGTTEIPDSAYADQTALHTVNIPGTVTKIGRQAFADCSALTSVLIPDSVKWIGDHAFSGCSALSLIMIPDGVAVIGDGAFSGCSGLSHIMISNVTEMGSYAFSYCRELTHVSLSGSLEEIPNSAFANCTELKEIEIPEGVTRLGWSAFEGCSSLTRIMLPESLERIAPSAFENCASLEEVRIPEGVAEAVWYPFRAVFRNCRSLKRITVPEGIRRIGNGAFENCVSLEEVQIPDHLTGFGVEAFRNCTSLAGIRIPEDVEEIGARAFENCTGLSEIEIHSAVRRIGDDAFRGCTGLKWVKLSANFKDEIPRIFGTLDLSCVSFI